MEKVKLKVGYKLQHKVLQIVPYRICNRVHLGFIATKAAVVGCNYIGNLVLRVKERGCDGRWFKIGVSISEVSIVEKRALLTLIDTAPSKRRETRLNS